MLIQKLFEDYSCSPVVKWIGGKRQLLKILNYCIDSYLHKTKLDKFSYHEPFFGGGALYFSLVSENLIKKAYLNDINTELVSMYSTIKNDKLLYFFLDKVLELEEQFNRNLNRDKLHEKWRARFNYLIKKQANKSMNKKDEVELSALLLALNKTSFNGIYRKNKKGEFNVPFNKKFTDIIKFADLENIRNVNHNFQNVEFTNLSFEKAINFQKIKKNHFVFLDPPYIPISKTSSFSSYYDDGFNLIKHEVLANKITEIHNKGAYFILTNSETELTKNIYNSKNKFSIYPVNVARNINQKGLDTSDNGTRELIITNLKIKNLEPLKGRL